MSAFNKVFLMGNTTRDVQIKNLPSGLVVGEFGMACNEKYRTKNGEDRESVVFVDVTAFGRVAEVLAEYAPKGKLLFIEGKLRYDVWEDKNGGGKRSKHSIVVDNFQFIGDRGPSDESERPAPTRRAPNTYPRTRETAARPTAATPPFAEVGPPEDDIPF